MRPRYEILTPSGYVNGEFRKTVYTETGKREHDFYEKTSKHAIYQIALQLAMRIGGETLEEALTVLEEEKSACKANGLI